MSLAHDGCMATGWHMTGAGQLARPGKADFDESAGFCPEVLANYDNNSVDGKWVDCKPASQGRMRGMAGDFFWWRIKHDLFAEIQATRSPSSALYQLFWGRVPLLEQTTNNNKKKYPEL